MEQKNWSLEEFSQELASEFKELYILFDGWLCIDGGNTVINDNGNVNYERWHDKTLEDEEFEFNGCHDVTLTKDNCERFKKILVDYLNDITVEEALERLQAEAEGNWKISELHGGLMRMDIQLGRVWRIEDNILASGINEEIYPKLNYTLGHKIPYRKLKGVVDYIIKTTPKKG